MRIPNVGFQNQQSKDFVLYRPHGTEDHLFVLFHSNAMVWSEGKMVAASPGQCIFFDRNSVQHYFPVGGIFLHDYIHIQFENPYEARLLQDIPLGKLIDLPFPEALSEHFRAVSEMFYSASEYRTELLHHTASVLLYRFREQCAAPTGQKWFHRDLNRLRSEIYNQPQLAWSTEEIGKRLNLSPSYLFAIYKRTFGITLTNDLIESRMKAARAYLVDTDLSVQRITELCGYRNTEHFIRQFRQKNGVTPAAYRKKILKRRNFPMNVRLITEEFRSETFYNIYQACMFLPTPEKFFRKADAFLANPELHLFAAYEGDTPVGVIAVRYGPENSAEIEGIATLPRLRGQGIGASLVDFAWNTLSLTELYAQTDDDAVGFYRKCGFTANASIQQYGDTSVTRYDCWLRK